MLEASINRRSSVLDVWLAGWRVVWRALVLLMLIVLVWARRWPLRVEPFASLDYPFSAYAPSVWIGSIVALAAVLAFLLAGVPGWRRVGQSGHRLFLLSGIGLAVWVWFSLLWADNAVLGTLPAIYVTLSILVGLTFHVAPMSGRAIAAGLAVGIIIQAAVAFPQFVKQDDIGFQRIGELSLDMQSSDTSVVADAAHDIRLLRAYGLSVHPNVLGGYLAVALLYVAGGFAMATTSTRWIWGTVLLAGLATLLVTFSRGAWLAFGVGGLMTGASWLTAGHVKREHLRRWAVLIIAGSMLIAGFVWQYRPIVAQRLRLARQPDVVELRSSSDRAAYDDLTLQVIARQPLSGTGMANLVVAIQAQLENDWRALDVQPTHRVPLLVLAELGMPGLALWVLALVATVRALVRAWPLSILGGAAAGSGVAMIVISLFDHYLWTIPPIGLLWWIVLASVYVAGSERA